jgi:preprotein translocase subunit SecE
MATNATNTEKANIFVRIIQFFKRMGLGIGKAFKNTFFELKKVTWPSKRELINYSLITIGFMVCMGIIIYLIDLGSGALVNLMLSIG